MNQSEHSLGWGGIYIFVCLTGEGEDKNWNPRLNSGLTFSSIQKNTCRIPRCSAKLFVVLPLNFFVSWSRVQALPWLIIGYPWNPDTITHFGMHYAVRHASHPC